MTHNPRFNIETETCVLQDGSVFHADTNHLPGISYDYYSCDPNTGICSPINRNLVSKVNFFCHRRKTPNDLSSALLKAQQRYPTSFNPTDFNNMIRDNNKNFDLARNQPDGEIQVMRFIWNNYAKIWGDVIFLYLKYMEGVIPASPTHAAELTLDVRDAGIQQLFTINKLGFITTNSQPGSCTSDEEQRQYFDGFYLKNEAKILFDNLIKYDKDNIAIIVTDANRYHIIYQHLPQWLNRHPDAFYQKYDRDTNTWKNTTKVNDPANKYIIPVTYEKQNDSLFTVLTSADLNMPSSTILDNPLGSLDENAFIDVTEGNLRKLYDWTNRNIVKFTIIAKEFCKVNILNDIIIKALIDTIHQSPNIVPINDNTKDVMIVPPENIDAPVDTFSLMMPFDYIKNFCKVRTTGDKTHITNYQNSMDFFSVSKKLFHEYFSQYPDQSTKFLNALNNKSLDSYVRDLTFPPALLEQRIIKWGDPKTEYTKSFTLGLNLNNEILLQPPLTKRTVTYSGVFFDNFPKLETTHQFYAPLSTSLDLGVAISFLGAKQDMIRYFKNKDVSNICCIYKFILPPQYPAAKVRTGGTKDHEFEILLPGFLKDKYGTFRFNQFKVTDISKKKIRYNTISDTSSDYNYASYVCTSNTETEARQKYLNKIQNDSDTVTKLLTIVTLESTLF